MATVEGRILGPDPAKKAEVRLSERKFRFVSENPNNDFVGNLPHVFSQEAGVRYAPFDGTLWLASYHSSPESPDIVFKRWSQHSSLESATGASAEILGKYGANGDVVRKTQALDIFIRGKLKQFGAGGVTDEDLERFQIEAETTLNELGFKNVQKVSKTKVASLVKKAMGPDSIGRRNPLISRTRLASALLGVLTDHQFNDKVAAKHLRLFVAFLGEQQLEESIVRDILESFSNGEFQPQILKDAARLSTVKAKPFRQPVMQACAVAFGIPKTRQAEYARYFEGHEELLEKVKDPQGDTDEIKTAVMKNLQTSLEDGESIYNPSV